MQTQTNSTDHTHLIETLSTMILQINALQAILCSEAADSGEAQGNVVAPGSESVEMSPWGREALAPYVPPEAREASTQTCRGHVSGRRVGARASGGRTAMTHSKAKVQASSSQYTQALQDGLTILEQMAQAALNQARSIDEDILPAQLIGVTLSEALSRAVEETAEKLGLSSRIAFSGDERALPSYTESLLYRIAQETLYQFEVAPRFIEGASIRKLRLILTYGHDEVQMSIEHDGEFRASASSAMSQPDDAPAPLFSTDVINHAPTMTTNAVMGELQHRIERLGGALQVNPWTGDTGQGQALPLSSVRVHIPYEYHEKTNDLQNVGTENPPDSLPLEGPSSSLFGGQVTGMVADIRETNTTQVRVLVVEAQAVTRAGLRRLLESYPDLQVVGEAADGVQAVSETLELGPQVVLIDMQLSSQTVGMGVGRGGEGDLASARVSALEAVRQIKQLNLNTHVLLLSALDREDYLYEALRAGAGGYVLKDIAPDELAQAIRTVARGEVLVHPQLARRLLTQISRQTPGTYPSESLTAREQEVLRLLARGLRNKEMAARLHVSERTINFHLANIYQKLNVSGRTEALSKALEQGLITAG